MSDRLLCVLTIVPMFLFSAMCAMPACMRVLYVGNPFFISNAEAILSASGMVGIVSLWVYWLEIRARAYSRKEHRNG